jgi:PAS domain S-box-containing protein
MQYDDAALDTLVAEHARLQQVVARQEKEIRALRAWGHPTVAAAALPQLPLVGGLDSFLNLVEEVFAAVLLADERGRVTWCNKDFTRLCGLELPQILDQPVKAILRQPLQGTAQQATIDDLLARQQPFEYDVPNPNPECPGSWIRMKGQPVFTSAGQLLLYAGLLTDITEERKAQLQLAQNELRFRTLIEKAPVAFNEWRQYPDGRAEYTYSSPKMQELFGLDSAAATQLPRYIHPDDQAQWQRASHAAGQPQAAWAFKGRLLVPGQPLRWLRGYAVVVSEEADGSLLYRGILEDVTSRMQAQEALWEKEQRGHRAMEAIGNDIWELDVDARRLTLSPEYQELLGYDGQPLELPAAMTPYQNIAPEESAVAAEAMMAHMKGQLPLYSATYRVTPADGVTKWISARGIVTERDERGYAQIITGAHSDVTEIVQTKEALEATSLRLSSTIANLPMAVLLEDESHRVVLINNTFCQLFDMPCPPEQLQGQDCLDLGEQAKWQFRDEQGFIERIREIRAQYLTVRKEQVELKNGRIVERTSVPLYATGTYIGRLWQYEDVTKRKKEELVLRRREEKYRGILENMNMGLVELDLDAHILFCNDSFSEITGYAREELLGTSFDSLVANEASRKLMTEKLVSRIFGIQDTYELPVRTKHNELKLLLVSAAPLYNDERHIVGYIGVHLDITHQKRLESKLREAKQQAEESAQAKEMFLANMSHEIRTPMNAIVGMSQLLAKTTLSDQQHNYLHAISSSAENLLVIINDILDLSKINAGQMALEQIGFSLRKVCEQVEKTLHYKAEDKGLHLQVRVSPDIPEVLLGDPYRITQVLLNLAGNSVKFTEKGEVLVTCELAATLGPEVTIAFRVSDTGIGIDPHYLRRLFKNFSQEDSSVSRKYGGTGLGLSISRSLVNLMGGELHIQSGKQQGTVSTFSLLLPVGALTDLPRKELSGNSTFIREGLRGKRVLLVEDNEYNRVLAKSFLRQAHIEVTEAENGAVAVELARQQPFDLVLMDVQMPVLNGFEATQQLRQELRLSVPIIALTANAIRGDHQKCLDAGMSDYLSKPFHEDELLKLVHEWLHQAPGHDKNPKLYRLDLLQQAAHHDQKFVTFMLRTFLKSSADILTSLHANLAAGDLEALKATAHKVKPSLRHLQILPALALAEELESWPGAFNEAKLVPLVESIDKLLRQVAEQITQDLEAQPEPATA